MNNTTFWFLGRLSIFLCLWLISVIGYANPTIKTVSKALVPVQDSPTTQVKAKLKNPSGPIDDYGRGTPQSSLKNFLKVANDGDYEAAARHLDLRYLPKDMDEQGGDILARKLKIVLDRALWIDMDVVSNHPRGDLEDGLPRYRDSLGSIKAGEKRIPILLQHVPRKDKVNIWKFSNRTVAEIPNLYKYHGFSHLEEYLEKTFPNFQIMGWHSWQWATYLVLIIFSYLIAFLLTTIACRIINKNPNEEREQLSRYLAGPVRIVFWIILLRLGIEVLGPSDEIRAFRSAATLLYIAGTWAIVRLIDLGSLWFSSLLKKKQRHAAQVLLNPIKTFFKIIVIITGLLLWLDNLGISVSTLMASLGIGGLAFALASQDMLKNLLGSIMILIDRPYEIGQRIIAKGHDGIVEEIGLRSTKIRLLNGHQVTIPNEDMARTDIENIGRRPHIKRTSNIAIPLDTPVEQVQRALEIIKHQVTNHECMDEKYLPRVYFSEFNRDALNITLMIWYCSNDFWAFQAFNQGLNLAIMRDFATAGIKLALPAVAVESSHPEQQSTSLHGTDRKPTTD